MSVILELMRNNPLGDLMRASSWVTTFLLIFHFTGLALLVGGVGIVDLRVLGVARAIPIKAALGFLPYAIAGFVMNLLTGLAFITYNPQAYWDNPAFKLKMLLIGVAGLNALYFTFIEEPRLAKYPEREPELLMKASALLSLLLWPVVIVLGRLIVAFQVF